MNSVLEKSENSDKKENDTISISAAMETKNEGRKIPKGIQLFIMGFLMYVIAALPEDVPALHVEQGFLLLKQVQGLPGDIYTVYSNALAIRDESYVIHHLPGLPQLETGRQVIPEDEVLLLNPVGISFDSRYLGPIGMQQIKCRVILILPYAVLDELKERLVKINETR